MGVSWTFMVGKGEGGVDSFRVGSFQRFGGFEEFAGEWVPAVCGAGRAGEFYRCCVRT